MVPAFFVNLHACGGGLSAIQFETAGSAQTMLSATPSRGMSLMVAGGVSLCELRPEDGRFVQRRHTPNSRPHAVSGSAQIAMPSPLRSNHLRKKGGQKTTTLQGPAPAAEGRIRELESSTATCHQQRQQQTTQQRQRKHLNGNKNSSISSSSNKNIKRSNSPTSVLEQESQPTKITKACNCKV